jgi:CheY-like chemotaxis protein
MAPELAPGAGVRVVVVDDERDSLTTLAMLLESAGFEVFPVRSANAVAAAVTAAEPHAVLMDLVMPGRSGLQLAGELRRIFGARCPVLMAMSGLADPATRESALESGFSHFLAKPYALDEVTQLLSLLKPAPLAA